MSRPQPSPFSLDGRVALVTGGTRGIGRATVSALAAAGARVAVCSRTADACQQVVAELERDGVEALAVPANLAHDDIGGPLVEAVMARWGRIDILVNSAGANAQYSPLTSSSTKAFDTTFAVNVRNPIQLVSAAVAGGMGKGGAVVNVASSAGIKSEAMLGVYAASKAAVISTTRTMARELGPLGIRVNAVAPGVIRTDFARVLMETPALHDGVVAETALGRLGDADEVAGAIVFLASDAASYVTGSVLVIDGGRTA